MVTYALIGMSGCRGGERVRADLVIVTPCYSSGSHSSWTSLYAPLEKSHVPGEIKSFPGSIGAWRVKLATEFGWILWTPDRWGWGVGCSLGSDVL
jgi:hypothetical protein